MAKRRAEEALEVTVTNSPVPKKTRTEDNNPPPPPPPLPSLDSIPPPPPPLTDEPERSVQNGNGISHGSSGPNQRITGLEDDAGQDGAEREEDEDSDEDVELPASKQKVAMEGFSDLYLDTISRLRLDFDFEKVCSVTLVNFNVYACLTCGKYYSGRGSKTPAYFHALEDDHHVFINMETKKVYVLPEGYEVHNQSLDDIKVVVDPHFTPEEVKALDRQSKQAWDLQGKKYNPGFVGLNNIKANDYVNVVVQALAHVAPLRNFFMLEDLSSRPQIVHRFSIFVRKLWNPRAFKSHVSPHELLQEVSLQSNKRFTLTDQSDPVDFLSWFLNTLHLSLGGSKTKPKSSLIQKIFQGTMRIESQVITARADAGDRLRFEDANVHSSTKPFTILTLDLPAAPLFQDNVEKNIIPQVPLTTILQKYNGLTAQEKLNNRLRYRLLHPLPPFLIMHIKRFAPNKFLQSQRNPTIVTFLPRALDMNPYVEPNPALHPMGEPIIYDLVANITYEGVKVRDDSVEGEAEKKVWKVQVREGAEPGEWWEMQDLRVERMNADLLTIGESYCMIWERRRGGKGKITS